MRLGTPWRLAVLASLALLVSGQLCMLTTCVPRLHAKRASAHSCCRATPAPSAPVHEAAGAMPCNIMLDGAAAPVLASSSPMTLPVALIPPATTALAAPARLAARPFTGADTDPPHERIPPAPAGPRAPPKA